MLIYYVTNNKMTSKFYIAYGIHLKSGKIAWIKGNLIAVGSTLLIDILIDDIISLLSKNDGNEIIYEHLFSYWKHCDNSDIKQSSEPFGKIIIDAWNLFNSNSLGIVDECGYAYSLMDLLKRCHKSINVSNDRINESNVDEFRSY